MGKFEKLKFLRERSVMDTQKLADAFAAALVVCLASMYVNYQAYQERHYLEWSYRNHGGEITIEFAPGWWSVHIYSMTPDEADSHKLEFAPVSLAVCLFALTMIGYAALAVRCTGEPVKDVLMLVIGYAVLFFGYRLIAELWEDYS